MPFTTSNTSLRSFLCTRDVFFLFLALVIMANGLWLGRKGCTRCDPFLARPFLTTGFFIFCISVLGSGGALDSNKKVLAGVGGALVLLFLLLTAFTIFAFVVTANGPRFDRGDVDIITRGEAAGGNPSAKFQGSSTWLQKRVTDEDTWKRIKRCLPKTRLCDTLGNKYSSASTSTSSSSGSNSTTTGWARLPPLESGCCRPPRECNFTTVNVTFYDVNGTTDEDWVSSLPSPASGGNLDCSLYSNNAAERCYACNSCKAAFLHSARGRWRTAAIINICVIALALVSSAYFFRDVIKKWAVGLVTGASAESSPTTRSGRCDPHGAQPSLPGQPSSAPTSTLPTGPAMPASPSTGAAVAEEVQEAERTSRVTAGSRSPGRDSGRPPRDAADCLQMESGQNQQWECSEIQPNK